jgi:hypothetical protein
MSKTQLLSVTKNLLYFKGKIHCYFDTINGYYTQYKSKDKWLQKLETGSSPAPSFLETPHTFLQYSIWKLNK